MKALYDLPAPAKLNWFLHVTGRRPDGYHLLQSVFMLIDWHDTLHVERRAGGNVTRQDLGNPLPPDDLCLRAARALQAASGTREGAHLTIEKRIPAQAGMGGGSSDAATVLLALNRLWGLNWPLEPLARLGLGLGADVPFFLHGGNAWVEGIGERITPVALPRCRWLVVKPSEGLETARIFSNPGLQRATKSATMADFAASAACEGPLFGRNDLQPVAQTLAPGVAAALAWLDAQGLEGRMTGSGSAVFARLSPGVEPMKVPHGWQSRVCGNLAAHPLQGWVCRDSSSVGG